jgi:hypothetical protein
VREDGGLIAGHARVLAARQLGIAEIPVMVAAGWSERWISYSPAATSSAGGGCSPPFGALVFSPSASPFFSDTEDR